MTFTHDQLVSIGHEWLRLEQRCRPIISEIDAGIGQIPDLVGWRTRPRCCIVIDAKASRSDFHAQGKKRPIVIGDERYIIAPKGMLTRGDVDEVMWGLLEVNEHLEVRLSAPSPAVAGPWGYQVDLLCAAMEHEQRENLRHAADQVIGQRVKVDAGGLKQRTRKDDAFIQSVAQELAIWRKGRIKDLERCCREHSPYKTPKLGRDALKRAVRDGRLKARMVNVDELEEAPS